MLEPNRGAAHKWRILVAEDNPTMITYMRTAMEGIGLYSIDSVTDGNEALNLITSKPYGLIVLDHDMPGMKGLDIIRTLSNLRTGFYTPIMLVTGQVNSEMVQAIRNERLTVAAVIAKPFPQDAFQKRVAAVMKAHRGR
ncbi:MAG: response regulator [Rhodospirillaceae bacterium]